MGLHDVLLDEMRDLYSAENQLVKALPKFAKAAHNEQLIASAAESESSDEEEVEAIKVKPAKTSRAK